MSTNSKYFLLLWSIILYSNLNSFMIKAAGINPYLVSVANVTLLTSNRAEAFLRIINTNQSFQSSPVSLLLILIDDDSINTNNDTSSFIANLTEQQILLNITPLPTQLQVLEKTVPGLIQDNEYTVILYISQTDRGLAPLQPTSRNISIMTTNVQSVSVQDDPNNCRLTITCNFAIGSTADGCMINYGEINSTMTSLFISRDSNTVQSASSVVSGDEYQSLQRNEMFTVEAYGVNNGIRLDSIETSIVFELTGLITACQDSTTSNKNIQQILGVVLPLILLVFIIGVIIITCAAVLVRTVRKRKREKQRLEEEEAFKHHKCSLCPHHNHYDEGGQKEERQEEKEEERDSPKPEYIEVLPDNTSIQSSSHYSTHNLPLSSPSLSPSPAQSQEEEETECTYENIGVSLSRRPTPKDLPKTGTPTGLVVTKKFPQQNGGVAKISTPTQIIKQTSLSTNNSSASLGSSISSTNNWNRRSMPSSNVQSNVISEEGSDDENEYIDAFSPLPSVALKKNKAYNSVEILPPSK